MTEKLVVIGGDAAGMSAASQARRLKGADALDITVLEQGPDVSYSACGIPYWVGDHVSDRDRLIARRPSEFEGRDIAVHLGTRAESIDLDAGTVTAADGRRFPYDALVVATGGRPLRPKVPGLGAEGLLGGQLLRDRCHIRARRAPGANRAVARG